MSLPTPPAMLTGQALIEKAGACLPSASGTEMAAIVSLIQQQQRAAAHEREQHVIEMIGKPQKEASDEANALRLQLAEAQGQIKALKAVVEGQFLLALSASGEAP